MTEPPEPLLDRTVRLMKTTTLGLSEIAKGARVSYEWVKKFAAGSIPDPSVNRVQQVHDFLVRHAAQPPKSTSVARRAAANE